MASQISCVTHTIGKRYQFARLLTALFFLLAPFENGFATAGDTRWIGGGPQGGLVVNALAVDPKTPTIVYAGTDNGLFKSTDGGHTWSATGLVNTSVRVLAIDPTVPSTLYAIDFTNVTSRLRKSIDGGQSWQTLREHPTDLLTISLLSIAIDPLTPSVLYLGLLQDQCCFPSLAFGTVEMSTDGGTSWTEVLLIPNNSGVNVVTVDPTNPRIVYAGTSGDGIQKSTDGGASWGAVNNGLTNNFIDSIAINPSDPTTLYAAPANGALHRSTDGGMTWLPITTLPAKPVNALAIDPYTTTTVYAGSDSGIYKSADGGLTWRTMNTGLTELEIKAVRLDPTRPGTVLTATNGGGVFRYGKPTAAFGDFNGDNSADIVWRNAQTGQNVVWLMNGQFVSATGNLTQLTDLQWQVAGAGDFNGDGLSDLVLWHAGDGQLVVWVMDGTRINVRIEDVLADPLDTDWVVAGVGDFDGNATDDLLWRHAQTGQNVVWLMANGRIGQSGLPGGLKDLRWQIGGIGDFNGDGMADILWHHQVTGQNVMWFMNGASIVSSSTVLGLGDLNWQVAGVGDFSGDGMDDILWRHARTGQNHIWNMNGASIASSGAVLGLGDLNWQVAGVGDFNGDGMDDILWRHAQTGQNFLWQMNGISVISSGPTTGLVDLNWHAH